MVESYPQVFDCDSHTGSSAASRRIRKCHVTTNPPFLKNRTYLRFWLTQRSLSADTVALGTVLESIYLIYIHTADL